jgi:hypothetical protein
VLMPNTALRLTCKDLVGTQYLPKMNIRSV